METLILSAGFDSIDDVYIGNSFGGGMNVLNKPKNALWGSTYIPEKNSSDWIDWCRGEGFYLDRYSHGIIYSLNKHARVLDISSIQDFIDKIITPNYLKPRYEYDDTKLVIDWNKVSEDYDAFHLSRNMVYYIKIYGDAGDFRYPNFYSWDVESWVIFNKDCIDMKSVQNVKFDLEY